MNKSLKVFFNIFDNLKINKNENPLKLLVENGALLWDKDLGGLAPLHHACISGNTNVVNDILNFPSIDLEVSV